MNPGANREVDDWDFLIYFNSAKFAYLKEQLLMQGYCYSYTQTEDFVPVLVTYTLN